MTTNTLTKESAEKVQELIEINKDSAEGFRHAAEKIENPALQATFTRMATDREEFATELQGHLLTQGIKPETDGTFKGKLHRWWMDFRSSVGIDEEYAILAEAERGEDAIKNAYESVMKETAGHGVSDVLLRQYGVVTNEHDTIRDLRDARKEA